MGVFKGPPKPQAMVLPPPPPPPPLPAPVEMPTREDPAVAQRAEAARLAAVRARGRSSTILTSELGAGRTLLGGAQ